MELDELIIHAQQRAASFRILSACYCIPVKELFFAENLIGHLINYMDKICPEASAAALTMQKSLNRYTESELADDYKALFSDSLQIKAPPYGSVHLEDSRRPSANIAAEVRKMYTEAGLVLDEGTREAPDHIAIELEFMHYLLSKEVQALRDNDQEMLRFFHDRQRIFSDKFLGPWVSSFCNSIRRNTENAFYLALADCTETYVFTFLDELQPYSDHIDALFT